ncbi:MAG: NAD-dependent epimerase/dehydratase family protein [Bdellovibrionia bacterium]
MNISQEIIKNDLSDIVANSQEFWAELQNKNIFITGGTGFFGKWLLQSFSHANRKLGLNAHAWALSRDPESFKRNFPDLTSDPSIHFIQGDVLSFLFPKERKFSHIIHAATEASAKLVIEEPLRMLDTIVGGTRRMLDFAKICGAKKFLLASSGAVYGRQPADLVHVSEDFQGAPDSLSPLSCYGEGKRLAEHLCILYQQQFGIEVKIARCFAFVGPYLPLDLHFAIGNFISNGLQGDSVIVRGDGTTFRSYLYTSDLIIWLLKIFGDGTPGRAYNIGSEQGFSISEIANQVAHFFNLDVKILGASSPDRPIERYVPSTLRARSELALRERVSLSEAIERTALWYKQGKSLHGSSYS